MAVNYGCVVKVYFIILFYTINRIKSISIKYKFSLDFFGISLALRAEVYLDIYLILWLIFEFKASYRSHFVVKFTYKQNNSNKLL